MIRSVARIWAVALNTFREAVRNRVLAVLVVFSLAMMGASWVLGDLSLHQETRVLLDLGLAGISIVGVAIALFLGVNLLSKELDRKTVYFLIPKPLHRWEFLIGKWLGMVLTLSALVVTMSVILAVLVNARGGYHGSVIVRAEMLVLLEVLLVTAVAMLFSSFSSPYLSAMFTGSLWVIGRNSVELQTFAADKLDGSAWGTMITVLARSLPDFHIFYISGASLADTGLISIHDSFVSWAYVGAATTYAAFYIAMLLLAGILLFARRDFV